MYHFPSLFPPTPTLLASLTTLSLYCPSFSPPPYPPPHPYPYLSPPDPRQGRPTPTISLSPALPYISNPPYIYPVSYKWKYTGGRYSGGRGCKSPSLPDPLY